MLREIDIGVHFGPELAHGKAVSHGPTGEEADLVACLLVAGCCIYGVDKNSLAVELARVSMWLATAAADHPLTFLNHRLVPGDSLLGVTTEELLRPFTDKISKLRKAPALTGRERASSHEKKPRLTAPCKSRSSKRYCRKW